MKVQTGIVVPSRIDEPTVTELLEVASKPVMAKTLPDGRLVELWRTIYNWRITVTVPENDGICFDDLWCYKEERLIEAAAALANWDGEGEPAGWNRHPPSGRWREDGTAATERNQRDEA